MSAALDIFGIEAASGWSFERVRPEAVRLHRGRLAKSVDHLRSRCRSATYSADDVIKRLEADGAELVLFYCDGGLAGFVVLCITTEVFTRERSVLVWALCATDGWAKQGGLDFGMKVIESIARENRISRIVATSSRRGLERVLPGKWEVYEVAYERRI